METQFFPSSFSFFSHFLFSCTTGLILLEVGKARQQRQIYFFMKKRLKENQLKDVFNVRLSLLTFWKHLLFLYKL